MCKNGSHVTRHTHWEKANRTHGDLGFPDIRVYSSLPIFEPFEFVQVARFSDRSSLFEYDPILSTYVVFTCVQEYVRSIHRLPAQYHTKCTKIGGKYRSRIFEFHLADMKGNCEGTFYSSARGCLDYT